MRKASNVRARLIKDRLFSVAVFVPGVLVVVPFLLVLYRVVKNGVQVINWSFLLSLPKPVGEAGGGILNAVLGTVMVILIAGIISVPIGVSAGVYLAENRRSRLAGITRLCANLLQSVPSIVIGIVMYAWLVVPLRGFSGFAGGIALAIMMVPVIVKQTEESVLLVPGTLKEASLGLGAHYSTTVLGIVLPTSMSGILSGITLAGARVAGETAPLLFTAFGNPFYNFNIFKPVSAVPLVIYTYATSPYPQWTRMAWGASLVLIVVVLALNVVVRLVKLSRRSLFEG